MRRNAPGVCQSTASRKRLTKPSLLAAPVTAPPMRRSHCAIPAVSSADIGEQFLAITRGRIMERNRPIGSAIDELPDERIVRCVHLLWRTGRDDATLRDEIEVIDDLERFVDVVGHDDRRDGEHVVQPTDELADDTE